MAQKNVYNHIIIVSDAAALHYDLQSQKSIQFFENLLALNLTAKLTVLPMTIHWPGPHKPQKWHKTQGVEAVTTYNQDLRTWASTTAAVVATSQILMKSLYIFDTYEVTHGEFSRDGVHYDDVNIVLAQLLLNYIDHAAAVAAAML